MSLFEQLFIMDNWLEELVGKYYKTNSKVLDVVKIFFTIIEFEKRNNTIYATVSKAGDYNFINITFKPFSNSEKRKFGEFINNNNVSYNILRNIVPSELLDVGVEIFPTSIEDFHVECKCGDNSELCMDAIAVLNKLREVCNEDISFIFELRGFDFKNQYKFPIQSIEDIFTHNFKENSSCEFHNLFIPNSNLLNDYDNENNLVYICDNLFVCLIEQIVYFSKNKFNYFKKSKFDKLSFDLNSDYCISRLQNISDEKSLFSFLMQSNHSDEILYLDYWQDILNLTFRLIKYRAIIPQIFFISDDKVKIRWVPAFYDCGVLNLCKSFYSDCPPDMITFNGEAISKENQLIIAVSIIMKGFIDWCIQKGKLSDLKTQMHHFTYELFFENALELKTSRRISIANQIAGNLSVFHMKELNFKYLLKVTGDIGLLKANLYVVRDGKRIDISDAESDELLYAKHVYRLFSNQNIPNNLFKEISMTQEMFSKFLKNIKPLLEYINVDVKIPFEVYEGNLKLKLDFDIENDDFFTLSDFNEFNWSVDINGEMLSVDDFKEIASHDNSLIQINGNYYSFNKNRIKLFKNDLIFLPTNFESHELLQIALLGSYNNLKFDVSDKFKNMIDFSSHINVPDNLNGSLRHYQEIGYSWLVQNIKSGFGSILADDMGLGKTVQVLSTILYLKENNQLNGKRVLIIAPTTLLSNWEKEIIKFTPSLSYFIYHGSDREFPDEDVDIVLTSFGIIRRDKDKFLDKTWFLCVVDEAQNIKNPNAQQTKYIKRINAVNRIALTGTPIENRLIDYWSIFDFTNCGYLPNQNKFKRVYVNPIEKSSNEKALNNLKKITKPFILRRLKTDKEIISDLPEKHVNDIYCSMTKKQSKLYDEILNEEFSSLSSKQGMKRKGGILKLITSLKQVCNHPAQYLGNKNPKISDSGKFELLIDILTNILDVGEKVIIFTQYVVMGEIIEKLILEKFNREVLFLNGSLSLKARNEIVDKFQNDQSFPILIATLKTGGVGLNLTAAQNVIHYDLWWNPAVENQATDRVYRIGQNEDVMVYRFITKGTLEENIDLMIKDKLELAGKTVESEQTFITELSNEELLEILSLRL